MKISQCCLILLARKNCFKELLKAFYQAKQVVKGMKNGISGVLCAAQKNKVGEYHVEISRVFI
ncbi:hypothetical protein [Kosakonia sp. SMBL-WEM22]|uniref:hypothetical protein n=1 Tax=Kosakonia sp. SMBL-WEM22 TaxID=2725560 RepID=UPI001CB9D443|nr:hypothetical protein [Kosakonia sp. SMBL-WEM22]